MKNKIDLTQKLYSVVLNEDLKEIKRQIDEDPLNLTLCFYDNFGTYTNRVDALNKSQIINRIYKRDYNIDLFTNILEH